MDAQSETGEVLRFWLTQRLCRELIKGVVGYFNASSLTRTSSDPGHAAAVQSYFHQDARGSRKPAKPVANPPGLTSLVAKLQLRTSSKGMVITLPLSDGRESALAFNHVEARQWLDILYQQYRVAEWPLDLWPDWIKGSTSQQAEAQKRPLH